MQIDVNLVDRCSLVFEEQFVVVCFCFYEMVQVGIGCGDIIDFFIVSVVQFVIEFVNEVGMNCGFIIEFWIVDVLVLVIIEQVYEVEDVECQFEVIVVNEMFCSIDVWQFLFEVEVLMLGLWIVVVEDWYDGIGKVFKVMGLNELEQFVVGSC